MSIIKDAVSEIINYHENKRDEELERMRLKAEAEQAEQQRLESVKDLWNNFTRPRIAAALVEANNEISQQGGKVTFYFDEKSGNQMTFGMLVVNINLPSLFGTGHITGFIHLFKSGEVRFVRQHGNNDEPLSNPINEMDENGIDQAVAQFLRVLLKR